MATKQNLAMFQGATFHQEFELLDANNNPQPVEGLSAISQIRKNVDSTNSYNFSTTLTDGLLQLDMDANTTLLIEPGQYLYDVKISSSNYSIRLVEGIITIDGDVSR